MPAILSYDGKAPRLAASVFLAEGSVVSGDVEIGEDSSLWFGTVVRGDVNHVRIGARTNLQDHTVVHVTAGALVPPRMIVPPGKLVLGSPARVVRDLTAEELAALVGRAARYVGYAAK